MAEVARNVQRSEGGKEKVHHTVTACVRCRQRKTRCDAALPRCDPCNRSNSHCEYFDSTKNRTIPRSYITSLQESVRRLNDEVKALEIEQEHEPDHESMARGPGLVKFSDKDESRFLGPSSGIAITRFVMEFAKENSARGTIKDVVPDHAAQEIKHKFDVESAKPTSKVYPLISSVAATSLPNGELMDGLLEIYMVKAQYMLPLLHEPTFREDVRRVYAGSKDPTLNFQVRLVIAISMQKLDPQYAGLADSYYLAALPYLSEAVSKRDVSTLQCFTLIGQYSLLTPTRTAAYWVIGIAAKLCQELELCDEQTIEKPSSGVRPNFLEIDMRRRLFWIITSMEYGLSHSLGRPSAFGAAVDNINVQFFQLCDDRYISADGLLPGHHPIMKKCISIHFLRMRLLQAEIRRTLYLKKRETPIHDQDPWFAYMLNKIDAWVSDCPRNDEGSGLSPAWFDGRKKILTIMMYRPSPQIPNPSVTAAVLCYESAVFNIHLQKRQVEHKLIDITWIFTQALCMALNVVLWSLSYAEVRQLHPYAEVKSHIDDALQGIALCADRWPGVRSALQLYDNLVLGCLRAYSNDMASSMSPSDHASPMSQHDTTPASSRAMHSPASTSATSVYVSQSPQSAHAVYHGTPTSAPAMPQGVYPNGSEQKVPVSMLSTAGMQNQSQKYTATSTASSFSPVQPAVHYSVPGFQYSNAGQFAPPVTQAHLPQWDHTITTASVEPGYLATTLPMKSQPWLANFGDEYSQYMHQPYAYNPNGLPPLSEQEQIELMQSLERSQLPDVSNLVSDSTTFYNAYLP